ncbi:DUF1176 domain-containing protein, partial [Salmonella enterica subsp. enterica serovar Kentucky]|nr:DUF1176 domain-containing protein [Salmonella enterica subsp. enterica serovar Kentucky]
FDEKTRELVTLAKGRGLTDCGIQTRWRYDGDRFRLVRYAEEPNTPVNPILFIRATSSGLRQPARI